MPSKERQKLSYYFIYGALVGGEIIILPWSFQLREEGIWTRKVVLGSGLLSLDKWAGGTWLGLSDQWEANPSTDPLVGLPDAQVLYLYLHELEEDLSLFLTEQVFTDALLPEVHFQAW